jgi:hypothetical protein
MAAQSVLLSVLNRLGGRTEAVAASRDLVGLAPAHLPVVSVEDRGADGVAVTAMSVEELMTRHLGEETAVLELLHVVARDGATRAALLPGLPVAFWTSRDPRDLARQVVQWAIDHPDVGLETEAFALARAVLDGPSAAR